MKRLLVPILGLALFAIGQEDCGQDLDGDGYSGMDDCDDNNAEVYPGAPEVCNGVDDDCDGGVDEGVTTTYYLDSDGDGYGDEVAPVQACDPVSGLSVARGDCDDADPAVYPGAVDSAGDGVDADCGGTDGADPHVGLNARSCATIQEALDAASDGQVVWVGPGTYVEHGLSMEGKAVALRSTRGEDETVVDGNGEGTVFYFTSGEGAGSVLDGFTIMNGQASENGVFGGLYYGGGMYLYAASPTLIRVALTGNSTTDSGGGMYLTYSSPTLIQVTLTGNSAESNGGGMAMSSSSPTLTRVTLTGNSAVWGGGMYLDESSPILTQVTLSGNAATGALAEGGGMYLGESSPTLDHVTLTGNSAQWGGGMYLHESSPTLTQVSLTGNFAEDYGGGMALSSSSPTLVQVTLTGNAAEHGGGMYLYSKSNPTIRNSLIAYNTGAYNVYVYSGTPSFSYCDVYDPLGDNLSGVTLDTTNLTVEPGFLMDPDYDDMAGYWTIPDLHLAPDSPLVDAGDPDAASYDPDGSRADIGIYGGPEGDGWDRDGDGYHDWFWPGTLEDAPAGFDPADWDADDEEPDVH